MKNNFFTNIKNLSLSLLLALSCLFSLNSTVQAQVSAYTVTQGAGAYTLYVPAQGGGALANATTTWDNTGAAFVMPWNMYYNADTYIAGSDNFLAYTNGWIKFGHGLTATFFSTHTNGDLITTGTDPNSFGMNANWAAQTWATTTGTWTLGASSMVVASAANISAGMTIYATGLPVGTIVTSVAGTTVNFSTVATAAGTAAVVTPRSGFWVFTIGTAPNRTMIVQYTKVRRSTNPAFATPDPATATTANFNFQIRFNEGGGLTL